MLRQMAPDTSVTVYTPPGGRGKARYIDTTAAHLLNGTDAQLGLGALDAAFARRPARVQLLVVIDALLEPRRFRAAVAAAVEGLDLGRVRNNDGSGCAVSVVEGLDDADFTKRPPPPNLFAGGMPPLTWRLSVGATTSAVGISFDHALCDMGGAALLLRRASASYSNAPGPSLHQDRACQAKVAAARCKQKQNTATPQKGGQLAVEYAFHGERTNDRTRHAVLFADVVALLREAGLEVETLSFTLDKRGRQLPLEHFGNSSVLAAIHAGAPLSGALDTPGVVDCRASVHFTSWARIAPADGRYLGGAATFAVGPATVKAAAAYCASRGGQPNVTVLPDGAGLRVLLVAPIDLARRVAAVLCKRRDPSTARLRAAQVLAERIHPRPPQRRRSMDGRENAVIRQSPGQRPAVVFFRGVGDLTDAWAQRLASEAWDVVLPEPPSARGWYPLVLPVTAAEHGRVVPPPIVALARESVDALGARVARRGDPRRGRRVVVGGFSQGGAVALAAAAKGLSGVVAVSAWAPSEVQIEAPTLFSCGTADPTVPFAVGKASGRRLAGLGATISHVQRARHGPTDDEVAAVRRFIGDCLSPSLPKDAAEGGCAACGTQIEDVRCRYRCVAETCDAVIQCIACKNECARCGGSTHCDAAAPHVLRREVFREAFDGEQADPRRLIERAFAVYMDRPLVGEVHGSAVAWWSYGQCGCSARALAARLPDTGTIAIHGRNSLGWLVADWACALKRAPSIAVDASVPPADAWAIANADHALTCALVDHVEAWQALSPNLSVIPLAARHETPKPFARRTCDVVTCLLTLGSTGAPKPLWFSAKDWADWCGASINSGRDRKALERRSAKVSCQALVAPLSHGLSRRMAWSEVFHGGRLGVCDTRGDLVSQIRRCAPTHLSGAPRFYALYARREGALLAGPRLRFVAVGGAAVPRDLIASLKKSFPEACVSDGYGMSEVPGGIARDGKVVRGVTVKLNGDGEILVKTTRGVIRGVEGDAWFHTGDLGRFVDGRLEVYDRKSSCVKLQNGEWLAPQKVEHALERCASIKACVVVAHSGWAAPVAVVVTDAAEAVVQKEVQACALAPWEVPRFVLRRDPFTEHECSAHGKVRRHVVARNHDLADAAPSLVERALMFLAAPAYSPVFGDENTWWASHGGDSVGAARLAGQWADAPISAGDVLRLAPRDLYRRARGGCRAKTMEVDWARECCRPVSPTVEVPVPTQRAVLLTGATGLLGPHLLKALGDSDVWVFCRPPLTRLQTKAHVIAADLSRGDLGISEADAARLRRAGIATIVHSAACVDAQMTYDELRAVNVSSLERVVAVCASLPVVLLVSSLSVIPAHAPGWDGTGLVPAAHAAALDTNYARSKLVAEHRLDALRKENMIGGGVVARLGLLDGPQNWLELTLRACAAVGAAPKVLPTHVGVLPPRAAATRLVQLVNASDPAGLVFFDVDAHSCGVAPVSVVGRLAARGVPTTRLPYAEWRRRCAAAGGAAGARAVAALPASGGFPSGARRRLREIRAAG